MQKIKILIPILVLLTGCGKGPDKDLSGNESIAVPVADGDRSEPALTEKSKRLPLEKIVMPKGFAIDVFAEVENARSLAISPSGIIYVGNRDGDKVYAVQDTDGDYKADKKWVIASGLNMPNGVAFRNGDLYVAEMTRIVKFAGIENKLNNPGKPEVINDDYPDQDGHGWKYIAFGPDGVVVRYTLREYVTQLDLPGIRKQKNCGLRITAAI
jgi:glucose/arabinose dehydrogenase